MVNPHDITYDLCLIRFTEAAREYIGPGKQYGYQQASDALGIDVRTIKAHVNGESMPELNKLMKYMALLGDRFVNRLLRLAGYDAARPQVIGAVSDFQLNAEAADLVGRLGEALSDGRIDHTEWPRVIKELRDVLRVGEAVLAQRDGIQNAHSDAPKKVFTRSRVKPRRAKAPAHTQGRA